MNKLLNTLKKTLAIRISWAPAAGPCRYEPSIPRVALGIAGVAMTVITIAVSVILPAQMDSGSGEPRVLAAANAAEAVPPCIATNQKKCSGPVN